MTLNPDGFEYSLVRYPRRSAFQEKLAAAVAAQRIADEQEDRRQATWAADAQQRRVREAARLQQLKQQTEELRANGAAVFRAAAEKPVSTRDPLVIGWNRPKNEFPYCNGWVLEYAASENIHVSDEDDPHDMPGTFISVMGVVLEEDGSLVKVNKGGIRWRPDRSSSLLAKDALNTAAGRDRDWIKTEADYLLAADLLVKFTVTNRLEIE